MTTTELPQPTTNPCVLNLVDQCTGGDEICLRALSLLLLAQPELVGQITNFAELEQCLRHKLYQNPNDSCDPCHKLICLLALARLLNNAGRLQEAKACYEQTTDAIVGLGDDVNAIQKLTAGLDEMLRSAGQEDAARTVRLRVQVQSLMPRTDERAFSSLRDLAFSAFEAGDYTEAQRIYRHLISRQFEMPGTCCHLARVLLATDQLAEAGESVELAWENREGAPPYVIGRIHYTRALLATLNGTVASDYLSALTQALTISGSCHTWVLTPVLNALRPRLTEESHTLFTRLAEAISDRTH